MSRFHRQLPAGCDQYHGKQDGLTIKADFRSFAAITRIDGSSAKAIIRIQLLGKLSRVNLRSGDLLMKCFGHPLKHGFLEKEADKKHPPKHFQLIEKIFSAKNRMNKWV